MASTPRPLHDIIAQEIESPGSVTGARHEVPAAYEGIPSLMAEAAQIAGLDAAVALFKARGGERVYIPGSAPDDHWLVQCLGREAADALTAAWGGGPGGRGITLELPRGPTGIHARIRAELRAMILDGLSANAIVRKLGVSRDMVKDARRKMRAELDSRQLKLFED